MSSPTFELEDIIYRAGAGAGKTTTLVNGVIDLALEFKKKNQRFPKMILTTFTRKATQEIRERLLSKAQTRGDQELIQYLLSKKELHISTIHGVLYQLLSRYGSHMGLDPGFIFADPNEAKAKAKKILKKIIFDDGHGIKLLESMSFENLTGEVIKISKALYLNSEIKPYSYEELKSTRNQKFLSFIKLAIELRTSIQSESQSEAWLGFAEQLLQVERCKLEIFEQGHELIDLLSRLEKPRYVKAKPAVTEETNELKNLFFEDLDYFLSEAATNDALKELSERYLILQEVAQIYQNRSLEAKLRSGKIEIDDLELFSLKLLLEYPDAAEAFSKNWDYWMIDEFQDTSPLQVKLLDLMIKNHPHLVVGDPQQSIYFFRGARSEVFNYKEKEILNRGGQLKVLDVNYRSEPYLLHFINRIVSDFGNGFKPMKPKQDAENTAEIGMAAKFGLCQINEGEESYKKSEFQFIAKNILDLKREGVPLESIAILSRKNSYLKNLAKYLEDCEIPTQVHAAGGFLEKREILDMLSILKFLVNPHDNANLIELLRSPWFRMDDGELIEHCQKSKDIASLWSYLQSLSRDEIVLRLKEILLFSKSYGFSAALDKAIIVSGLVDLSHFHDTTGQRESNIWKFISQLREESRHSGFHILNFINNKQKSLALENYGAESEAAPAFEPNRINLMTIHMSKGLQFDYVFLPNIHERPQLTTKKSFFVDLDKKRWACPLPYGEELRLLSLLEIEEHFKNINQLEIEENMRLFYVSVTRAKRRLFISYEGKEEKNSWLSQLTLPQSEGIHTETHYSYIVDSGPWSFDALSKNIQVQNKPIEPVIWSPISDTVISTESVTRVLEKIEDFEVKSTTKKKAISFRDSVGVIIEKAHRGTMMHKLFEMIHYHGFDKANEFIKYRLPDDQKVAHDAIRFIKQTNLLPLQDLILKGAVEWGFLVKIGQYILEGQIDLWGKIESEVWVIDYKTGDPAFVERARKQLELYALALSIAGEKGPFKLAVVFPLQQKVSVFDVADFSKIRSQIESLI